MPFLLIRDYICLDGKSQTLPDSFESGSLGSLWKSPETLLNEITANMLALLATPEIYKNK